MRSRLVRICSTAALRTQRDRAMVQAMLLGGLRRCEVLGLRLTELWEHRVHVTESSASGGSVGRRDLERPGRGRGRLRSVSQRVVGQPQPARS